MPRKNENLLGVGLYSPSEAARYARVSSQKLSRWLFGAVNAEPVLEPQLGTEDRIVTFTDFAQALSVHEIRLSVKVPLSRIRLAYQRARSEHDIEFPFAVEHGIFVFGNLRAPETCELGIYLPNRQTRREFLNRIQLTGKKRGNFLIGEVVRQFSDNLVFSGQGVASGYVAHESHGHRILIDPDVRFGKPYLEGIGYEAETLAEAVSIEKTPERAARLYKVELSAVKAAVSYREFLKSRPTGVPPKPIAA